MMKLCHAVALTALLSSSLISTASAAEKSLPGDPLPRAKPEDVGFSSERLNRIDITLTEDIDAGRIPGAVIAIARHGKLVMFKAYGWRDKDAKLPMTTDTIFNIASMTKPMVTVGALMLYEQGKISIDDPLSRYFPQFLHMKVAGRDANGDPTPDNTVPAVRQITLQDLMRHTSGIVYGGRGSTALHKLYPSSSASISSDYTGPEFLDKLASLPLFYQPATVWDYGFGLDVMGQVIEKVSDQKLGDYLKANLWTPLGMKDTGFSISPQQESRYAKPLDTDPVSGKPQTRAPELTKPLKFECGGGCAASTAADYLRFALFLMHHGKSGEGKSGGKQLLGRKTVEYMLSNQLGPDIKNMIGNADPTRADFGFGLGLAVRTTPGIVRMLGSVGQFSWPGASGTDWWADPKEDLAVVYMSAAPGPARWHYRQVIDALVYQALVD